MFRFSFLTTLNIYKDYFKGRQRFHSCTSVKQLFQHFFFHKTLKLWNIRVFKHENVGIEVEKAIEKLWAGGY